MSVDESNKPVPKHIAQVFVWDDKAALHFTDGTFVVVKSRYDGELSDEQESGDWTDWDLMHLGLISVAEYERRDEEQCKLYARAREASERHDRARYEELKAKFGGSQ